MLIITERNVDIIRKTIEMKYEELIHNSYKTIKKKINEGIDDLTCRYTYPINKNLSLFVNVYQVEHKKTCRNYVRERNNLIDDYHDGCNICNRVYGYKLFFILQYNEGLNIIIESFGIKSRYKNQDNVFNNTWRDCIAEMESIIIPGSEYIFCKCGELCTNTNGKRYDTCANCYINSYTRSEDCCICLDNGYCWVQLACKHSMHSHCWNKITKGQPICPLCRAFTTVEIVNPYN